MSEPFVKMQEDMRTLAVRVAEINGKVDKVTGLLEASVVATASRQSEITASIIRIEDRHIARLENEIKDVRLEVKDLRSTSTAAISEVKNKGAQTTLSVAVIVATCTGGLAILTVIAPSIVAKFFP